MVAVNLIENNQTTVTEKQSQRGGDCDRREDVAGVEVGYFASLRVC